MKILHIVQLLSPGGIEQFVLTLLRADFNNTYVLVLEGTLEDSLSSWPVLSEIQSHLIFADLRNTGKKCTIHLIKNTCEKNKITVLHSHYSAPLLYACLSSFGNKINFVHTEHDVWHLCQWKHLFLERTLFFLNKDIHLVAVSSQIQKSLKKYFPKKKSNLIHNAIDTQLFNPGNKDIARKHFNLPFNSIIIGSAGRLVEVKGHRFLIQAMQYMPENMHLIIAGDGPLRESLQTLVTELNLNHRVQFLGLVNNMDIFYQSCDIFCLPSLYEGLPLSLLEAQSCDVPTACSDVGSCSEGLDILSGQLIPSSDPIAIAEACVYVHEKKGNPRQFILNNFSLELLKEKYMRLYLDKKIL